MNKMTKRCAFKFFASDEAHTFQSEFYRAPVKLPKLNWPLQIEHSRPR